MINNSFLDFTGRNFIEIGNFQVAWYAVCILTGILLAGIVGIREAKKFGIAPNLILDGILICVPLAILGARLYYVFTSWNSFVDSESVWQTFLNVIGFTEDGFRLEGLAINGGIIVAIVFVIIYCMKRKMNTLVIFDQLAPGLLIGQICGRWGNFFNQEAHGPAITAETEWITRFIPDWILERMYFVDYEVSGNAQLWHPTFLYESVWNLIGLTAILVSRKFNKLQRIGDSICFYLIWYGFGRAIIIEPLRTDPLLFSQEVGPDVLFNRVNIVINLLLAVGGIVWLTLKHLKFKEPLYIQTQKDYKANKIDGVICRIDDTLVTANKLAENTYYYTAKECLGVELSDEELEKLVTTKPEDYFEDEKAIEYFYKYFNDNLDQVRVVLECKEFFKKLFKYNYHVVVMTKYDKEYALNILELLKINTYVSIIVDKDLCENQTVEAFRAIPNAKNIMVVSSKANDICVAKEFDAKTCLVYYGKELDEAMEYDPTYVINKVRDFDNILVD